MDNPSNQPTQEQYFDGTTISPQFALALRDFMSKNGSGKVKSGQTSIPGSTTAFAVAHGLPGTPNLISVSGVQSSTTTPISGAFVSQSKNADATNIYIDNNGGQAAIFYWAAALL